MLLAVDVDYRDNSACVAGLVFDSWEDSAPKRIVHSTVEAVEEYEPGKFYLREMPCILQLLNEHRLEPDTIIVDGYVYLGEPSHPGLGMHLYHALNSAVPIVGVAKKPFKGTQENTEVFRGESSKPLYVTAIGIAQEEAKAHVQAMYGMYRLPALLKRVDQACRRGA